MISALHEVYPALYGNEYDEKKMDERFSALIGKHREMFGKSDPAVFSAAGRTEIGGNHTDHNLGKVIGGSLSQSAATAASSSQARASPLSMSISPTLRSGTVRRTARTAL